MVGDARVKIVSAEVVVAAGGEHLNHTVVDLNDRDIERAAAQIVDEHLLLVFIFQSVRQCGRCRLIDDAADVQSGDCAGIAGRLTLGIVEIGRNRDDRLRDRLTEIVLCVLLEVREDHRGQLLRRKVAVSQADGLPRAHLALDGGNGQRGINGGLPAGGIAHQTLPVRTEADDGRRGPSALPVGDDGWFSALHNRDTAVGCT